MPAAVRTRTNTSGAPRLRAGAARVGRPRDPALARLRRDRILDAAERLFARHGYKETDPQAVADAVGIGKATLYRSFKGRRALFMATVDRAMRRLEEVGARARVDVTDPIDRITSAITAVLLAFEESPHLVELMVIERAEFRERKRSAFHACGDVGMDPWSHLITGLMKEGRLREMPFERVHDVVGDMIYGSAIAAYVSGRDRSAQERAGDICDVLLHGILSDRERARRKRRSS